MKIEKVNENQIRCTLTREDLEDREIKLSELAYGTEKAKTLFRDMMQMASYKFGFEAENIPLMIEAIPLNSESIVLIITKVEDPEELDTRFANFAPSIHEDVIIEDDDDDIADIFSHNAAPVSGNKETAKQMAVASSTSTQQEASEPKDAPLIRRLFSFSSLGKICELAGVLKNTKVGENAVYKNPVTGQYLLLVSNTELSVQEFSRLCNIISEYGHSEQSRHAVSAYLDEHYETLIKELALQKLADHF